MAKRSNDINLSLNISGEEKIRQLTAALRDADAEIEKLQSQLEAARAEAQQFQDAFDNLKFNTGVAALEEELSRFRSTARESVSEFSSFLKAANLTDGIPQYDDRFSELFRKIEDGSMTASQAIAKVKTDFAYLMQENFSKSGGAFDSQVVQQFSASLERLGQTVDVVLQKLESIETNGVKSMTGGTMSTGISDITQMFSQIMQAAQSMSETASTSVDSISNLVGAIGRFASIDGSKLLSVSQAFRSLSELHSGSFGTKSVDNIISLAERLRKLNEQGSFRLRFDLSGLKDFKVSSTIHHLTDFINNLSEDKISVLERLQQINLSNFNSANFKIDRGSVSGLKELLTILNTSGFDAKSVSDNAAISKALTIAKDAESVRNAMSSMSAQTQASMTGTLTTLSAEQNQLAALNTGYLAHAQTVNEAAAAENNKAMMSQLLAILLEREMASMQNSTASAQEHANVVVEDASAVQSASSAYSEHAQLLLSDADASESSIAAARNRAQALLSAVSATQQSAQADSVAATASEQLRNAIQNLIQAEQLGVITGQQFATTVQALYAAYSQMGSATQQIYPMLTASADAEAQGAASAQVYRDAIIASAQARQQNTAAASAMNGAIEGEFHDIETSTVAHTENAQAMLSEASAADALTSAMTAASGAAQEGEASERQYHDALAQVSNVLKNVQNAKAKLEGQKGGIYRAEYAELTELESKLQTLKSSGMSTPFNELRDSISEIRHGLSDALQQMNLFTISEKEAASASKEFDQQRAAIKNLESLYNQLQSAQEKMQGTHSIMEVQTLVELQEKLRDIIAAGHEGTMSAENLQKAYSTLSSVFSSVMTSGNALISASKDRANAEREEAAAAKEAAAALKEKEAAEATRQSTMRQVNSLIVQCTNAEKKYALASKLPSAKDNFKGIQETKRQLQELSVQLENGSISMAEAKAKLNDLSTAFSNNSTALKTNTSFLGNYMTSGLGMLKSRLMYTFGLANVVMKSIQGLKKMISTAVELDTAMNQLQIVTRASGQEMDQYGERVTSMAMETAQSTKDLIDATTVYARLGYDMDESAVLAKYTAMLQGVGDIEAEAAQNAMTAIIKAFNMDVSQVESVMDKLVTVGNNFPISVSQIAEGMNNASSMLAVADNSFEESVALLTAANTTVQNVSKASTGLRTIAARIRKTTTGEDDEGEIVEEAKYQEMINALTKHHVDLVDQATGEYRKTYDIIRDISRVWGDLTSMEQAAVIEALAGTRQQNIFTSLVTQFQEAEGAMEKMKDSAGELQEAYDIRMSSIQAHVQQLKVAFDSLSMNVVDSDVAKGLVDVLTNIVSLVDTIISKIGVGGLLGGITAITVGVKALTGTLSAGLVITITNLLTTVGEFAQFFIPALMGLSSAAAGLAAIAGVLGLVAVGFIAVNAAVKSYREAHPTLEMLKEDAQEAQQAVNELQSEFDTKADRIEELKKLQTDGSITAAQEAELANLQSENAMLEEQLALLKEIADYKKGKADEKEAQDNRSAAESFFSTPRAYRRTYDWNVESEERTTSGMGGVLNAIDDYNKASEKYEDANDKWHDVLAKGEAVSEEQREQFAKDINTAKKERAEQKNILQQQKADLIGSVNDLGLTAGQRAGYQALIGKISDALGEGESSYDPLGLKDLSESEISQLSSAESLEELESFLNGSYTVQIKLQKDDNWQALDDLKTLSLGEALTFTLDRKALGDALDDIGSSGNVDLKVKPKVDESAFKEAGWDTSAKSAADLYAQTFHDTVGEKAALFTPVYTDEDGNTRVLGPEEFKQYCQEVMDGAEDVKGLKITADFEGADAFNRVNDLDDRLSDLQTIQFGNLIDGMDGIASSAAGAAATVESLVQKITTVKEQIDSLKSISSEAFSDTGLSLESVGKLETMFKDFEGFNSAEFFDATANGIRVNAKELENFTDQYYEMQRSEFNNVVRQKMREANDLGMQYLELSESERQAAEGQQLLEEWQGLQTQIEKAQQARAEIDGMTSAYMRFLAAQSTPNENDQYLKLASYFDTAKKQFEMGFGYIDDVTEFLDTIFEDRSGELADNFTAYNELFKEIGNSGHSISDFFTPDDSQGVINFLDTVQSVLGSDYVKKIGEGDYEFDFGGDKLFKVADELNLSAEAIQILEHAMVAAGFDVKFDTMADEAARAAYNLKEMGELRDDFFISDIDTSNVDAAISKIQGIMEQWRNGDTGKIDLSVEGASEAEVVLRRLYDIKNQVPTVEIPVEVKGTQAEQELLMIQGLLEELGAVQTEIDVRTTLGEDTTGLEERRDEIVNQLSGTEIATNLGLDTAPADTAYKSWKLQVESGTVTATVKSEMQSDGSGANTPGDASVNVTANTSEADAKLAGIPSELSTIVNVSANTSQYASDIATILGAYLSKTIYITTVERKVTMGGGAAGGGGGGGRAQGTAHASGTAYKGGDWGAKKTETALVGEVGPEIRVRDGQWELLGEDSAEMASIRKGDIIFNAEQTRQILKNGKIVNGMRRGVAYLTGTAYDTGSGAIKHLKPSKSSSGGGGGSSKGSKNSSGDDSGKIDWIEVLIDRLTFAIDNLAKVAQSNLKALATRVSATNREIDKTSEKLNVMRQAFDRYQEELSTIELDSAIKGKIENGAIDISSYDDDTQNKIKEYQQWYEKALDCWGAIEDLHQALGELYTDNFNNAQKDFENQLTRIERTANMAQKDLDMARKKGYLDSAVFYETMAESQAQSIDKLNVELQDLTFYFEQAMGSHEIEEGSEAWYEMQGAIDDVKEALADANIQLLDYQRTLMKLNWDYFDYAHDRLKQISQEANFLIDVMSNDKLFQDNGKFSELGEATAAMRAVNYNEFMLQADEYNKERLKIERQLVNDPYDKELIARREALLQLQQQSIQAAESEKDAVANLVEQGINMELEALQELINTYKESLDSAKDLYEYQKKVTEKTADIASIQKQLSAYTNDTSEETRAKVQKLQQDLKEAQTDLQEVERDQNINDQKKLLDDLYTEYEDFLNARLDDVDLLMRDIIAGANENMAEISTTIREVGAEVGYTITDAMQNILHGDFANYDHAFEGESSVAVTLGEIYELVAAMARASGAVKAYATGGLVDYTGMAAVHGSKSRPELMLNASDTENFLAAAAMLRDTRASSAMSDMSAVHSIGAAVGGVNIGQISLGIQIDHVQDYNDLITQMRNDPKFERLIGAMTLDRAVGKSSFSKNRIVF